MQGFFSPSLLTTKAPQSLVPKCGACKLHKTCITPKMEPTGAGKRKILVVAEAPGVDEDKQGVQLVGKSGQRLRKTLDELGIDLDRDCWKTNAIICRPPDNATPTDKQVDYCQPNLINLIKAVKPHVIIPLGGVAVRSLIGWLWKENPGPVARWVGWRIPVQRLNAWVCPTFHPSYLLRSNDVVLDLMFKQHLEQAIKLRKARPYETIPDFASQVEVVFDDVRAAQIIDQMVERGGTAAFDYETDRLKPDGREATIVSCSICWEGKRTIAYPWAGRAVEATRRFVRAKSINKVGSNIKFEERWTRAELDCRVRNWKWCTMLGAHVLDNRRGITSIKFQSFVRLGQESYNDHIEPFFNGKGGNKKNRIKQIDMGELLLYNGLDSLLEYWVAVDQLKELVDGTDSECDL